VDFCVFICCCSSWSSRWANWVCECVTKWYAIFSMWLLKNYKMPDVETGIQVQFCRTTMPIYFSSEYVDSKWVKINVCRLLHDPTAPLWEIITCSQRHCSKWFVALTLRACSYLSDRGCWVGHGDYCMLCSVTCIRLNQLLHAKACTKDPADEKSPCLF